MIICGYAGTGKSTAARKIKGVVDLESTPFQKDWDTYARVAKHMSDQGYIVLLSCHKELREKLHEIGEKYIVVYPDIDQREEYKKRYIERGNTQEFIDNQMSHWDEWVGVSLIWTNDDNETEEERIIFLEKTPSGYLESMSDIIDDIIRYGEGVFGLNDGSWEESNTR